MGVVCLIIKVTGKLQIYGPLKKKKDLIRITH